MYTHLSIFLLPSPTSLLFSVTRGDPQGSTDLQWKACSSSSTCASSCLNSSEGSCSDNRNIEVTCCEFSSAMHLQLWNLCSFHSVMCFLMRIIFAPSTDSSSVLPSRVIVHFCECMCIHSPQQYSLQCHSGNSMHNCRLSACQWSSASGQWLLTQRGET